MILKKPLEYYKTDQALKQGSFVVVWNDRLNQDYIIFHQYSYFDPVTGHWAGGMNWVYACPVQDPKDMTGEDPETPEAQVSSQYGDIWAKAYIASSGDEKTADDTLSAYKVKEAGGDFDKAVSAISADPV